MRPLLAQLSPERLVFVAAAVILAFGPHAPAAAHLSPESGAGYALGIVGAVMMLLLLVYPARKRIRALSFIGGVPQWFRIHMILGVLGPVCILFHSNFSLGAVNSNVALFCMLTVAVSGFAGRYFYSHLHLGLYGRKASLAELQGKASLLKSSNPALPMLPDLMERIEAGEARILSAGAAGALVLFSVLRIAARTRRARRKLRGHVRVALRAAALNSGPVAAQHARLERAVLNYIERRLQATRQVAEFSVYERLFSLWHLLHLPLFLLLLVAGIVHVIAVHVY